MTDYDEEEAEFQRELAALGDASADGFGEEDLLLPLNHDLGLSFSDDAGQHLPGLLQHHDFRVYLLWELLHPVH